MHTKEPWALESGVTFPGHPDEYTWAAVRNEERKLVLYDSAVAPRRPEQKNEAQEIIANFRRIVACVNALAGVPTEQLEKFAALEQVDLLVRKDPDGVTGWQMTGEEP